MQQTPAEGSGPAGLGTRVAALESTLTSMSESLDKLTEHLGQKKSKRVHIDPQAVPIEDPLARAAAKYTGLDPSVVSAAINAGVSEENLMEMQRMLSKDPTSRKKLREPALRKTQLPSPGLPHWQLLCPRARTSRRAILQAMGRKATPHPRLLLAPWTR